MARKAKVPQVNVELTPDQELLKELRRRWKDASEADQDNREQAMLDMKFVHQPGAQWDDTVKIERGARVMYEFNKLRATIKRVVNDMRASRPAGKVRPVEDSDKDTADVYEGLIRNIWNVSDGDTVIDRAAEYQVSAGMGAWRIRTKYASDDSFDQDICIESIRNPFCLYADPGSEDPMKRDARYWFLTTKIPVDVYEQKYPGKSKTSFDATEFDDDVDWRDEETIRVCEYWRKVPIEKTLWMLSNGDVIDASTVTREALAASQIQVLKERVVGSHRIEMCIVGGGDSILEPITDHAGREFPFVIVYGEELVIDGKNIWFGLPRFVKDAQKAYNYSRTSAIETVALAPQAKWWATPEQAKGLTNRWAEAHKKNFPFMLYNPDPKAPGTPQRMGGADVPAALISEMQIASEDIKAITGIYDASLGNRSNETSGIAIRARQNQGDMATFNYMDNLSKGVRRTWEIFIDLIPRVIDTERAMRILGADGGEKYVRVNQTVTDPATGQSVTLNDLSRGKYDVTITSGPSFSTQRQEASETYMEMSQGNPQLMGVAGDLIFKALDLPYADEISERLKTLLPPQIQQSMQQDGQQSPEVQQAMQQAQQAMQQVQQHGQLVQQAEQEMQKMAAGVQGDKAAVDKAKAELQIAKAQLQTEEANLEATFAKMQLQLVQAQCKASDGQASVEVQNDREALGLQVQQAIAGIQQNTQESMQQLGQWIAQVQATQQQPVAAPPRSKVVHVKRVNGELVGTVQEIPDVPA